MRVWNFKISDPLELTLASDARLIPINQINDQIWKLTLRDDDNNAITVSTTFGLRARNFRIFLRFIDNDKFISDPYQFHTQPIIHKLYPNYVSMHFDPFIDINARCEYWVPDSQTLINKLALINSTVNSKEITVEWIALLAPLDGESMTPSSFDATNTLCGNTFDLYPVMCLSGGAEVAVSPLPSLRKKMILTPGEKRQVSCVHSAWNDKLKSGEHLRFMLTKNWDAEISHIDMENSGLVEIYTGEAEWNMAFYLSQKVACSLLTTTNKNLPINSFVLARQPDLGYSFRGDGSDFSHLWSGISPIETYFFLGFCLPSYPNIAINLLQRFLVNQKKNGFIDLRASQFGKVSNLNATPILASIAWKIFQYTQDENVLINNFQKLFCFFKSWFLFEHDQDADGFPEWKHAMQTGFEENPFFTSLDNDHSPLDIAKVETPSLLSYLYHECKTLIKINKIINHLQESDISCLINRLEQLEQALLETWSDEYNCFMNRDRNTHLSTKGGKLINNIGNGRFLIDQIFNEPIRVIISIKTANESTIHPEIIISGTTATGNHQVNEITHEKFHWFMNQGTFTDNCTYTRIDFIDISGLGKDDRVELSYANFHHIDHTQLLPLWASASSAIPYGKLVNETVINSNCFWSPFGIPTFSKPFRLEQDEHTAGVSVLMNHFIGEGLVFNNYPDVAANLVQNLMAGIINNLRTEKSFFQYYNANSSKGTGYKNCLSGLAPLELFLETLGLRIISSRKVAVRGINPYPWPVTVKYQGLSVLRQKDKCIITFPDGQSSVVDDPKPCMVSID